MKGPPEEAELRPPLVGVAQTPPGFAPRHVTRNNGPGLGKPWFGLHLACHVSFGPSSLTMVHPSNCAP